MDIKVEGDRLSILSGEALQCSIVDIAGRLIGQSEIDGQSYFSLNKGMYIINLRNDINQESFKLIMK